MADDGVALGGCQCDAEFSGCFRLRKNHATVASAATQPSTTTIAVAAFTPAVFP
jgi:hypothetical protein